MRKSSRSPPAFNLNGELNHAALNYTGSGQYSKVAYMSGFIHPIIYFDEITKLGFAMLFDSAFTAGRVVDDRIVQGRKANESNDVLSPEMAAIAFIL